MQVCLLLSFYLCASFYPCSISFSSFLFVRPDSNHALSGLVTGASLMYWRVEFDCWLPTPGLLKSCWGWKWCWKKSASIFCERPFCVSSTGYMETWLSKISLEEMLWLKSVSFHQTFIWSIIKQRCCCIFLNICIANALFYVNINWSISLAHFNWNFDAGIMNCWYWRWLKRIKNAQFLILAASLPTSILNYGFPLLLCKES